MYIYIYLSFKMHQAECFTTQGVGDGHQWMVSVGYQSSNYSTDTTRYIYPTITELSTEDEGSNILNLSTQGLQYVAISGTNFGPISDTNIVRATYKSENDRILGNSLSLAASVFVATSCRVTVAHTKIVCQTAPGVGKEFIWSLWVR
jgi:hypothetical protein